MNFFKTIKMIFDIFLRIREFMRIRKISYVSYNKLNQLKEKRDFEINKFWIHTDLEYLDKAVKKYSVYKYHDKVLVIPLIYKSLFMNNHVYYMSLLNYIKYGNKIRQHHEYLEVSLEFVSTFDEMILYHTLYSLLALSICCMIQTFLFIQNMLVISVILIAIVSIFLISNTLLHYLKRDISKLIEDYNTYDIFVLKHDFEFPLTVNNGCFEFYDSMKNITYKYSEYRCLDTISDYIINNKELYT